jgi:hypothetical protein
MRVHISAKTIAFPSICACCAESAIHAHDRHPRRAKPHEELDVSILFDVSSARASLGAQKVAWRSALLVGCNMGIKQTRLR